jgi:hypothetical protein
MHQNQEGECSTDIQRIPEVLTATKGSPSSNHSHEGFRSADRKLALIGEAVQAARITMRPEDQRKHALGQADHVVQAERLSNRQTIRD